MTAGQNESRANMAKARVTILGEEYTLRGEGSEEYIVHLCKVVDARLREIVDSYPNLPRHKAAILAAIYLADEVEKLRQEKLELEKLLSELE